MTSHTPMRTRKSIQQQVPFNINGLWRLVSNTRFGNLAKRLTHQEISHA